MLAGYIYRICYELTAEIYIGSVTVKRSESFADTITYMQNLYLIGGVTILLNSNMICC